jgi:hypothetical protein
MAFVTVGTLLGGATLELDIRQGRVSGIQAVNRLGVPVIYQLHDAGVVQWEQTLAAGQTLNQNIPNNRRFDFETDLASWGMNMTPVWG